VLHDLAGQGLLRVEGRRIVIPEAARLAGSARSDSTHRRAGARRAAA
jgi:hypothetical protein